MKLRFSLVLLTIGILCIFPMIEFNSSVTTITDMPTPVLETDRASVTLAQLTPHAPIDITSESQFTSLGFPGNGSESNPYLIEDLEIQGTSGSECISIAGSVLAYYEIRGCSLFESSPAPGIYLGAGHGLIESCEIYNCSTGIMTDSDGHSIVSSEIHNTSAAIVAFDADNILVQDSAFYDNDELIFDEASSLTITGNSFSSTGVTIGNGVGITVTSNTFDIEGNYDFLTIYDCQIGTVRSNVFNINAIAGLQIQACADLLIQDCDFIASGPNGVGQQGIDSRGFDGMHDITIEDCTFQSVLCDASYIDEGLLLADCTFTNGGILTIVAPSAIVQNNRLTNGSISISLNCSDSTVFNNTLTGSVGPGIRVDRFSPNVTVSTNSLTGSGEADHIGIYLKSDDAVVQYNTVENYDTGIFIPTPSGCTIHNNTIFGNNIGIEIGDDASSNHLYYNILYQNTQNANDDGTNNIWDDGVSLGNYWSNLAAPGEYTIPGTAGSVDRYAQPYSTGLSIPPVLLIVVSVGVVGVIVAVVFVKRR